MPNLTLQVWTGEDPEEEWPNTELWDGVLSHPVDTQGGWQGTLDSQQWKIKIRVMWFWNIGEVQWGWSPEPNTKKEVRYLCCKMVVLLKHTQQWAESCRTRGLSSGIIYSRAGGNKEKGGFQKNFHILKRTDL